MSAVCFGAPLFSNPLLLLQLYVLQEVLPDAIDFSSNLHAGTSHKWDNSPVALPPQSVTTFQFPVQSLLLSVLWRL